MHGARLRAISYELPVASAQVKSCVLLAALAADGATTVGEPARSRDHTERMLLRAGVGIHRNGRHVTVVNADELLLDERRACPATRARPRSSIAAGVLVPRLAPAASRDVGVNWTRTGFLRIAAAHAGDRARRPRGRDRRAARRDEPVSDLDVAHGALEGTVVEADEVPLAIDELPLVALLGCFAEGETVVRGAQELRVKESDRIAGVVEGLRGLGAEIEATEDGFAVRGTGGLRGGTIDARGDHRLAMLGAVAGLASREGVEVVGMEAAAVSYPGLRRGPGARLVLVSRSTAPPARASRPSRARVARELGFTYLDSGAMYRCVALLVAARARRASRRELARAARIELPASGARVLLDGRDVSEAIRTPEVVRGGLARWRADPGVREALVAKQRALIAGGDWVAEGRDIGTVVAPDAAAEGLPDGRARTSARAGARPSWAPIRRPCSPSRRCATSATPQREHSPLRAAAGRRERSTRRGLGVEQVVERIAALARSAGAAAQPGPAGPPGHTGHA